MKSPSVVIVFGMLAGIAAVVVPIAYMVGCAAFGGQTNININTGYTNSDQDLNRQNENQGFDVTDPDANIEGNAAGVETSASVDKEPDSSIVEICDDEIDNNGDGQIDEGCP